VNETEQRVKMISCTTNVSDWYYTKLSKILISPPKNTGIFTCLQQELTCDELQMNRRITTLRRGFCWSSGLHQQQKKLSLTII